MTTPRSRAFLDANVGRQDGHVDYVKSGKQLLRTQPHDLRFSRVETETTGFQPGLIVGHWIVSGVWASDSFHILSCAVVRAVVRSGFRDNG